MLKKFETFIAAIIGIFACNVALAESVYSTLDLSETCEVQNTYDEIGGSASWVCQGYGGVPVYVAEGDLRFFVSFGEVAESEPAAGQTLGPWNRLGPTIEWVLEEGIPVATILRWYTDIPADIAGEDKADADGVYHGEVLVITQLGKGRTCHIGYVDARSNKNPNKLARDAAGLLAGIWDCTTSPKLLGGGGLSLGLTD
ncbi:hypothetical protein PsAD2_03251 [Pseudovibrio axinellae]|uniref:Uncharacterized protein n=1 Tax=Pseudovibrio axinellae TaxID=989403 RepID=A0A165WYT2_9HYPH|nr:hypothetical protein [Pseudovibrio axinellae]KZL17048.1 hypothetical protein PsAD2_03251 [Pseudovibrio axinellae]SEQ17586.1 hypothetical protein SAMN05421798_10256 [Pseudovibrio axinellae]